LSLLLFLCLLPGLPSASAQDVTAVFVAPSSPFITGSRGSLWLYCMNNSSNAVMQTFATSLSGTLKSELISTNTVLLLNTNARDGIEAAIAPGGFAKKEYFLDLPAATGQFRLEVSNFNPVVILVQKDLASPQLAAKSPLSSNKTKMTPRSQFAEIHLDHISNYEPIYFLLGTYPAAEFQISIKYQVFSFTNEANLFENVLDHSFFAYTQTSFWDVLSHNPRFYDSSYKPSVFLFYTNILQSASSKPFQFDLQGGTEHESNGQGGTLERSLYSGYLQPTATIGLPENLELMFQPRARFFYFVGSNNPDIAQYRGYADLLTALTWQDPNSDEKIQFSTKLRIGDTGTHLGLQFDLRFNLTDLGLFHAFNPTIQVQYFTGYGQNLLQYNQSSQDIRAGLCLWY